MPLEQARKPNRRWIWYFVVVGCLTVLATTILVVFNRAQQLTPEQLEAARKLWDEKRPADYLLTYTKLGSATGTFIVTVRKGKVVAVVMRQNVTKDGQVQVLEQRLEPRLYRDYDMDGLFNDIEVFLDRAAKKDSPRTFLRATFDARNGQLLWFVRSVMSTGERIEIRVQPVQPPPPEPSAHMWDADVP
jgi:hypothetical protein